MALLTSIIVDLLNKTDVLTVTSQSLDVETIIFQNSQVTFSSRGDINISGVDFLSFIEQVNLFQTSILFNFAPNVAATTPFNSVNSIELKDSVNNKWNLLCVDGSTPRVCNYSSNLSNKTVDLFNRANSKTIEFPEWIYFLYSLNHYKSSIKNYFNL